MGTVKYSGPVASFHCPTEATIRSLKVHFSPKQEGSGTPSPENIRPIEGWDGVEVYNYIKTDANTAIIPSEYKKVEYLQNIDNAYLILNYVPKSNTKIIYKAHIDVSNGNAIFCSGTTDSNDFRILPFNHTFLYDRANARYQCNYPGNDTIIEVGNNYCKRLYPNPATLIENESTELTNMTNLYLFTVSYKTSAASFFKLYEFQVYEENELFVNLIPCFRKSDNKPGMYDTVSQTFYTNVGTGEFLYGPEVSGYTTNYEFGVLGKNKFDKSTVTDYRRINRSGELVAQSGMSISDYIKVIPNQTYTITTTGDISGNKRHAYYDINKEYLGVFPDSSTTITIPENARYIRLTLYNDALDTTQLELGSTATTYEPYDPNKTVYGGWVDLISGEVCEEYGLFAPDENSYITVISGNTYKQFRFQTAPAILNRNNGFCTHFTMTANPNVYGRTGMDWLNLACQLILQEDSSVYMTTVDELKSWLATQRENGTPFQIVYQAATPNTYYLAPTQLQTFLGQNNVWSNADYVEVEYDLHETQTILARKQFIIANQPHIVKPAAAPLQNFVTDMAAPLKECKVHFSPVQEGEGDPSPENVRAISGWTECKVWRTGKNLIDESYLADGNNYPNAGGYAYYYTDDIQLAPNTRYRFVWYNYDNTALSELGIKNIHLYVSGASEYIVNNANYRQYSSGFITPTTGIIRLGIYHPSSLQRQDVLDAIFNNGKLLLQIGTDDIAYEPYSGITLPIDWATEAGTVYGGYVDLVKGEVWKDWDYYTIDGSQNIGCDGGYMFYMSSPWLNNLGCVNSYDYTGLIMANNFQTITHHNNLNSYNGEYLITGYGSNSGGNWIYFKLSNDISGTDNTSTVKSYFSEHPLTVYFKLKTPTLITTLTLTQLKSLRGTNNIWASNGGDNIEIAYWKH